ncbi:alginate lyase family protein [Tabrizicola sp. M-4]|uniref:alginate lyase family protein n=1 Tax=Tabrizicola sp. M-4 TaxID=3055847 RepID=UPI003DA8EFA9
MKPMQFVWAFCALISLALPIGASVQARDLPADFIADRLGPSCTRFFSPSRLSGDLRYVSELRSVSLQSTNSLTMDHDAISKRWTRLLGVAMGAAARNDQSSAGQIIDTLVGLAEARALLGVMSVSEAQRVNCWAGGNKNSVCPYHVVQHSGFAAIAMIMSASMLEEHIQPDQKKILEGYFDALFKKFIGPLSKNGLRSDGLYEFADYGIGVLAYARWTGNSRLATSEINARKRSFLGKINADGLIDNNSFRGYRGYWYHTLGAESAFGYALVARRFGVDLFNDRQLGPRLRNLAIQVVNGANDYASFRALPARGNNAARDVADEIPHMHQFAVNLPRIIQQEYGLRVPIQSAYRSKGQSETISRLIGFNADCYYDSR